MQWADSASIFRNTWARPIGCPEEVGQTVGGCRTSTINQYLLGDADQILSQFQL